MNHKKPPLGLLPRDIHDNERLTDIGIAMRECISLRNEIPAEWIEEYNELRKKYRFPRRMEATFRFID